MKNKSRIDLKALVFSLMIALLIPILVTKPSDLIKPTINKNDTKEEIDLFNNYINIVKENKYVAHALGGIDNYSYTNSKEAIELSLSKGFKLFELDIKLTKDNKLVCVHGWKETDYNNKLGIPYDTKNPVLSYNEFMNIKIQKKYTPLSYKDFTSYLTNNDMYVMLDVGNISYNDTLKIYKEIFNETEEKDLNKLIVGGHTSDMIKAVKEIYDFKIINLYWAEEKNRTDEKINTKEKFLNFCKENGISSLSTSTKTYKKEKDTIKFFKDNGLIVYVFTENDKEKANNYLKVVDLVGTDFINNK